MGQDRPNVPLRDKYYLYQVPETVRALIDSGADIKEAEQSGQTSLMLRHALTLTR
jgi:hypothetical protein